MFGTGYCHAPRASLTAGLLITTLARQVNLTGTPTTTPGQISNMTSPFGSIYNGPEKIVIGIDLGTTMSCVLRFKHCFS